MDVVEEVGRLKRLLEKKQREKERIKGALEETKKQLHKLCGTTNIKEATKLIQDVEKERDDLEVQLVKAMKKYKEKFADVLDN